MKRLVLPSCLLCASLLFWSGCATHTNRGALWTWGLWGEGFGDQVSNNPISRASKLVHKEGVFAGLAQNKSGHPYSFLANTNDNTFELKRLPPNSPRDAASAMAQVEQLLQDGGEVISPQSPEARAAMKHFKLTSIPTSQSLMTGSHISTTSNSGDVMVVAPPQPHETPSARGPFLRER